MKKRLIAAFISLILIACSKNNDNIVDFQTVNFEENIPLNESVADSTHYHIKFQVIELTKFPVPEVEKLVNQQLNKEYFETEEPEINSNINESFHKFIETLTIAYRNEGKQFQKDYSEMSHLLNFELIKNSNVVYNKNNIFSVEIETYSYSGGAHGVAEKVYRHFDLKTGKLIGFKEMFFDGAKEEFKKLVQKKCDEMKKSEDCMLFSDACPEISECFYFDNLNLYFVYNPYEIAPFAAGYVSIDIPVKDIVRWIDKDGPVGFLKKIVEE